MTAATLADIIRTVSPSKLETAIQCGAKTFFRYVQRLPENWRADAQFGNAVDATGNRVYADKLKTGRTASKRDVAEIFAEAWDYESGAVEDWQGDSREGLQLTGVRMMQVWREGIAQWVEPESTQTRLEKEVQDPVTKERFKVTGIVDLVGRTRGKRYAPSAVDLKQSRARYPADKMLRSFQPVAYTLLTERSTFEFHVMVRTRNPQPQVLRATIANSDRQLFVRRAGMVRRQIEHAWKTGDWIPNRAHFLCSRRYCPHWQACEKTYGGTVPA